MALFVPTIDSGYVRLGLIDGTDPNVSADNAAFNALRAAGVLAYNPEGLANLKNGGDKISVPSFIDPPDFVHTDVANPTNSISPTTVDASTDVAITTHDNQLVAFDNADAVRAGADATREWSMKTGGKMAKRAFTQLMRVAIAAVDAVDTPTSDCHTTSIWTGSATGKTTVAQLQTTKALLGDAASRLTTLVLHSKQYFDLLTDLRTTYGAIVPVSAQVIQNGAINGILGLSNIIVSDLVPTIAGGTGQNAKYSALLLGPNALWYGIQRDLVVTPQVIVNTEVTRHLIKAEYAAVQHLRFVKWNAGTTNPSDSALFTTSNWDEGFYVTDTTQHKRVLCAKLVTD